MDFRIKWMQFALIMMHFVLEMMKCVFKNDDFCSRASIGSMASGAISPHFSPHFSLNFLFRFHFHLIFHSMFHFISALWTHFRQNVMTDRRIQ